MIENNQNLPNNLEAEEPEIIENKDKTTKGKATLIAQKTTIIQSPFPPPELLEKYKEIDPSFPERILKMVEEEQKHRHKITSRGQIFALIIGIGGLFTTLILGLWGNPWVAGAIGFASLATLVGAFLESRKNEKNYN